ncbi:MAG: FAD:protein FMN transferase [Planctomycetota bacterium]|nr:FAD:protein FMN transferase [Planctomycetota bacterium]MDA1214271.1 FAD:protein FMN transferase [Planctomycetota bacterium]
MISISKICVGTMGVGLCCIVGTICETASVAQVDAEICDGSTSESIQRHEYLQIRMGIPFSITLYATDQAAANRAVEQAYKRIRQLDRILSDYDPDSEVNRLCREGVNGNAVFVSPELMYVLKKSLALSRQSEGAFDVSIGPVVSLWRRARRQKQLPNAKELAEARERVGYRFIQIDDAAGTVTLKREGMRLDFGGIAKGYAADEAARILHDAGINRVLIAASGDIVAGDPPPGKSGWRIGIASLVDPEGVPERFVSLCHAAISTSGDTYQFVEIDGVRYSHIVNPHTGIGLTVRRSVTVIASCGTIADSFATVGCILGAEPGIEFMGEFDGVEALFAERTNAGLQIQTTPCFKHGEEATVRD